MAHLYPHRVYEGQSFKGVKVLTKPGEVMSLQEMFRRFVRRESLPVEKKGVYLTGDYDLEKVALMDRVEKDELLDILKAKTAEKEKVVRDKDQAISAEKAAVKAAQEAAQKLKQNDPLVSPKSDPQK